MFGLDVYLIGCVSYKSLFHHFVYLSIDCTVDCTSIYVQLTKSCWLIYLDRSITCPDMISELGLLERDIVMHSTNIMCSWKYYSKQSWISSKFPCQHVFGICWPSDMDKVSVLCHCLVISNHCNSCHFLFCNYTIMASLWSLLGTRNNQETLVWNTLILLLEFSRPIYMYTVQHNSNSCSIRKSKIWKALSLV